LHRACYFNRLDIVKVLINAGAKLEHKSMQRITPLQTAVSRNKAEIVRTLLDAGAKFDLDCPQIVEANIKPEVRKVLDDYQRWMQIRDFLRFHSQREGQSSALYPAELKNIKRNYFIQMVNEYM
jgi:ankyrin repeat protein